MNTRVRTFGFYVILLLCAINVQGQDRALSFTVHAGSVFSTIQEDPKGTFDPKFRTGFFAGASLNIALSERWEIPIEVQYAQRGFHYNTPSTFIVIDNQLALFRGRIDYRLTYLELAPKVEFQPIHQIGIAAGPYLSYRLSESARYKDVIEWTSTKKNELYKDTDFGLMGKLTGYLGPVSVFAAFQYGLSNISSGVTLVDENGQDAGKLGLKTRAVFVGVGWRI